MTTQLVKIGVAVLVTLLGLLLAWQLRIAIVYVLISVALAAAVRPVGQAWVRRRGPQRIAALAVGLLGIATLVILLALVGTAAAREIRQLIANVSALDAWQVPPWLQGSSAQQLLTDWLPAPGVILKSLTDAQGHLLLTALLGFSHGLADILAGAVLVLFLTVYWSIHQTHFERLWLSLLPAGQRKQVRGIWRSIEPQMGAYIRSEIFESVVAGVLSGLGYWALRSPYPALLAVAGAIAYLIPVVGAALAVILILLVGLATSLSLSLSSAVLTILVFMAVRLWLKPRMAEREENNPFLTVAILIVLFQAFGLPGLIVAPPLSRICQILWSYVVSQQAAAGAATRLPAIKERQERLWGLIKTMDQPPPPLVTSSMQRLGQLIEKSEPLLQTATPLDPAKIGDE
jgi:putative permease